MRETLKTQSEDPVSDLMGVELSCTLKCDGTDENFTEKQTVYALKCNITSQVESRSKTIIIIIMNRIVLLMPT
jgi:hypothetical protein